MVLILLFFLLINFAKLEVYTCNGTLSNNTDIVCSGHGDCIGYNNCSCDIRYDGDICQIDTYTCYQPQLFYLYDNCAGTRRSYGYYCDNQGNSSLQSSFMVEEPNQDGSGHWYIDEGYIDDSPMYHILDAQPEYLTVSIWFDPAQHTKISIYNIIFTMYDVGTHPLNKYILIDDGLVPVPRPRCYGCYDTSPGKHHYVFRISTQFCCADTGRLDIYKDAQIVYTHNIFTLNMSSTNHILRFYEYVQEEDYYKTEIYFKKLTNGQIDDLYQDGLGWKNDTQEVCFVAPSMCEICDDCEDEKAELNSALQTCLNNTIELEIELETCLNFTQELNENLLEILGIVNETNVNVQLILELIQICCNNQCNLTEVINLLQLIIQNQDEYFNELILLLNTILLNQTENFGEIISILNQITNIQIPEIITLINQMLIINNDNFTIVINLLLNLLEYQNYTFTQTMELLNIILTQQTLEFDQLTQLINFFISNTNSSFEHVIDLLNILINDETCQEILDVVIQIANGQNVSFAQILEILNRLNGLDIELMIDFFNNFNQTQTTLQIVLDWVERIMTVKWLLIAILIIIAITLLILILYIIVRVWVYIFSQPFQAEQVKPGVRSSLLKNKYY